MRTYIVTYRCSYFDGLTDEGHIAYIEAANLKEAKRTAEYHLDYRCGKGRHKVLAVKWRRH